MNNEETKKQMQALCERLGLDGVVVLGLCRTRGINFVAGYGLNGPEETGLIEQHRLLLQARYLQNITRSVAPSPESN